MKTATILNPIEQTSSSSVWIERVYVAARLGLGFLLLFAFANALLGFAPQPPLPPKALAFMGGLMGSGYFFAFLKGTEVLVALALVSNRFVPLALVVLAPVTLNIVLFHAFLAPAGIPVAVVLLALHLISAWSRRESYRTVLAVK